MNFRAGIHVLVKKEDQYLIIKRWENDNNDPGCWDLPGGGIDWGEQPNDAAVREVKEETGVDIKITKLIGSWALQSENDWSVEFIAEGAYKSGEVQISSEHDEFKWVCNEQLKNISPRSIHLEALFMRSLNLASVE